MKINWGTGIVLAIAFFMAFILFMVIKMTTNKGFDHDLVVEEYYQKDLAYQQEIDAEENLKLLSAAIRGEKTKDGWLLTFPQEIVTEKIKGSVFLYRPSNKQLDFDLPIVLSGANLLIPDERLLEGRWNITIAWEYKEKKYLYKKAISY